MLPSYLKPFPSSGTSSSLQEPRGPDSYPVLPASYILYFLQLSEHLHLILGLGLLGWGSSEFHSVNPLCPAATSCHRVLDEMPPFQRGLTQTEKLHSHRGLLCPVIILCLLVAIIVFLFECLPSLVKLLPLEQWLPPFLML